MYLPECQQPPVKASPRQRPIGLREEDGACGGRIFFSRELPGRMLAGGLASSREHENTSRERCGSKAGSPIFIFFTIG